MRYKEGSRAKPNIIDNEVIKLIEAYILDKKLRRKL
jgi:hypothetical protein